MLSGFEIEVEIQTFAIVGGPKMDLTLVFMTKPPSIG
jgi:hypothetical protein